MNTMATLDPGSWDWTLSALPGRATQVLSVDKATQVFYATVLGDGLYQSLDGCATWTKVSDFNGGSLYYHQKRDFLLVGGAYSSELLMYENAQFSLVGKTPTKIALPEELGHVVCMEGKQQNAFENDVYVAQETGITYTQNIRASEPKWNSLKVNGDLPSLGHPSRISSLRLYDNRLYCTLSPYDYVQTSLGVGALVSDPLSVEKPASFSIILNANTDIPHWPPAFSMGDIAVIDGKTVVSVEISNDGSNGLILYANDIFSAKPDWLIATPETSNGASSFATWDGYDHVFAYALEPGSFETPKLVWMDFQNLDAPFSSSELNGIYTSANPRPRPYITSNNSGIHADNIIYLPCDQGVYFSPIYVE